MVPPFCNIEDACRMYDSLIPLGSIMVRTGSIDLYISVLTQLIRSRR
jgi:hypothetical protein